MNQVDQKHCKHCGKYDHVRKSSKKCLQYVPPLAKRNRKRKRDSGDENDDKRGGGGNPVGNNPPGGDDDDDEERQQMATTIAKLATVCTSGVLRVCIELASRELTMINYEASRLANAIIFYSCNSGIDIPRLNLTFCAVFSRQ